MTHNTEVSAVRWKFELHYPLFLCNLEVMQPWASRLSLFKCPWSSWLKRQTYRKLMPCPRLRGHSFYILCLGISPRRTVRQEEVLNWSQPEVRKSRQKLSNMVYLWFGLYLGTVTWVTLCYVLTYDTVTIWCVVQSHLYTVHAPYVSSE